MVFWLIWGQTLHHEEGEREKKKRREGGITEEILHQDSTSMGDPLASCSDPFNLTDMPRTIACKKREKEKKERHTGLFIRGLGKERKTAGGCSLCASTPSPRGRTHYKDNVPHTCRLT